MCVCSLVLTSQLDVETLDCFEELLPTFSSVVCMIGPEDFLCEIQLVFEIAMSLHYIYIYILHFFVALRPKEGHGPLILEVSRSHTTTQHSR